VGVVPGILLAFIFIPIKPLFILKNQLVKRNRSIRKVFVFLEISLLAIVVMGILIVNLQLFNLKNRNLGFNKNNIVLIQIKEADLVKKASVFKNAIKKYPDVLKVSASDISVGFDYWVATLKAEIGDEVKSFDIKSLVADEDFFDLYELELLEGRSFEINRGTDINNCLINESAVRKLGFGSDVINRKIQFGGREPGTIIGVVKDFYFYSKHNEIEPLFIYLAEENSYTSLISVKIAAGSIRSTLRDLSYEWKKFSPDSDFTYTLVEDRVASFYSSEERLSTVLKWGTVLSFFIVSFGLICFVFFVIGQRIKEISIRKVNGASTPGLIKTILFKEFLVPGMAALILVFPLVHFSVNGFLQSMVTELSVKWWIYLLAMFIILLTVLITTFYQLYKAANRNPVDALSSE
jgi:putative ABC transport system permease protein